MKNRSKEYYTDYKGIDIGEILYNSHLASKDLRKNNRINKLRLIPRNNEINIKATYDNISINPLLEQLEKLSEPAPIEVMLDAILDVFNKQITIAKPIEKFNLIYKYITLESPMILKHKSLEIISSLVTKNYNEYKSLIPSNLATQLILLLQNETKSTVYEIIFFCFIYI